MNRLSGKVAIVTGASQGMGAFHAKRMIEEGAKVVLTDILEEKGKALAEKLGENAIFVKHDVSNEEDWKNVIEKTLSAFGKIDILVNNAGIGVFKPLMELTLSEVERVFRINTFSVFLGTKAVVPHMMENGGSIINISSMDGIIADPGSFAYGASKFAVNGMTKNAASELGEFNIRVNAILPGPIATDMATEAEELEGVDDFTKNVPLKRMGKCEEVSNLLILLASDEAKFITGAEYLIDGGMSCHLVW